MTVRLTGFGRSVWSLQLASSTMALGAASRQAADEEARAEVDVLQSRLEKTGQLTKKIQASLTRLESNGRSVQDAIGPLYGNTQKLQVLGSNIDAILAAIQTVRQPSDIKSNEEDVIRRGPDKAGLSAFLSSVKRVNKALADMKQTNLRSNQQALSDLSRLLKSGNSQMEMHFQRLLQEDSQPLEPLYFITKGKPFPMLSQDKTTRLGLIHAHMAGAGRQGGCAAENPLIQSYASIRGPYLTNTLQNLASASVSTARKRTPDAVYRQGTNGISSYASGLEAALLAEYDNICALFARDEWSKVFNLTCQGSISELARTLRDLNQHIRANLTTDCYLAYEIIEIMTSLMANLEARTGELKQSLSSALKPIRETAKTSLGELVEDTRRRVNAMQVLPSDGSAVPITVDTMTRLQNMVDFLRPISSIMISIGEGGWKNNAANVSSEVIPNLNTFDVSADGRKIFGSYSIDTINTLMSSLDNKGKVLSKSKATLGVFLANNATIIDRMVRTSDLIPLLSPRMGDIEKWRKTGSSLYTVAWREPSTHLLDVQYTNRGARPPSQSGTLDSASIVKALSGKDKESIKEKFRLFNTSFEELVAKHKSLNMEREVREMLARQVQGMIEPLYYRFWDRYHDVDKGKGKYVKYDKAGIAAVFAGLA